MPKEKLELEDDELIEEMEKLEDAVRTATVPLRKQIFRGFLTGLATTFGTLVAAAIIIPLMVYFLKDVKWIPLIGTFVENVSNYTERKVR